MNLETLNPQQREAVCTTEGPVLVLAGAGSGKTRVLTYRIAHLIEAHHVFPSNILAITFTNKAANEMKSRIEALVGDVSAYMWVGTFHSICVRILRQYGDAVGYGRDFVIYDTADQKSVMKKCYEALNIDEKRYPLRSMQHKISGAKNDMLTADAYAALYGDDFRERVFVQIYTAYQERLKANQALDFDDLLLKAIEVLKTSEAARTHYQIKFRYIHVDEYQDTNKAQYELVRLLSGKHGNVFVVGDGDQSIYRWRGADIRNIREFERDYPGARSIVLEQNYRSTQTILSLANQVIRNNPKRRAKNLWTGAGEGERVGYYQAYDERDEARFVVSEIRRRVRDGAFTLSDFAILYRTNAQSRALEEALMGEGLRYQVVSGQKFYERKEIKDVLGYLKLIVNRKDDVAFLRVVNEPKRSIGAKTVEKIALYAEAQGISYFEACGSVAFIDGISGRTEATLSAFYDFIETLRAELDTALPTQIFDRLLSETGIIEQYQREKSDEADARVDNIYELRTVVEEFEKRQPDAGIRDFLAEASLHSDQDNLDDDERNEGTVVMMTLHAAKGLEFPVVFLVGLEESLFPSFRSLDDEEAMEEERRLCYVGITRAERVLYVTHARNRTQYGRFERRLPSVFLEEMEGELLEAVGEHSLKETLRSAPAKQSKQVQHKYFRPEKAAYFGGAKPEKSASQKDSETRVFKPGQKVNHKIFGTGTVITVESDGVTLTIAFDGHGIKKLQAEFAPLRIIG